MFHCALCLFDNGGNIHLALGVGPSLPRRRSGEERVISIVLGLVFFQYSFGFSFLSVAHVCQAFNQVCVAFNVFLFFAFSLSCSTMFWFDKANRLSAIFFHFGVQTWRFPGVSIATSVLHSITLDCTL